MVYQTIEWHQNGQSNAKIHIEQRERRLQEEKERLEKDKTNWKFKEGQIQEAIKRGMQSFDDERLLIKNVPKSQNEVRNR